MGRGNFHFGYGQPNNRPDSYATREKTKSNFTVLIDFKRSLNTYPLVPYGGGSDSYFLGTNLFTLEEECARICVAETRFTCRQFYASLYDGYCEWFENGEFVDGNLVAYRNDTLGDRFLRRSTCKNKFPYHYCGASY